MQWETTRAGALLALLAISSCSVPEITFAADDAAGAQGDAETGNADSAGLDSTSPPDAMTRLDAAGGSEAQGGDGSGSGASADSDAGAADSGLPEAGASCPGTPPPGAVACCSTVPCAAVNAGKCQGACSSCEASCTAPGQICCVSASGAFNGCAQPPTTCH